MNFANNMRNIGLFYINQVQEIECSIEEFRRKKQNYYSTEIFNAKLREMEHYKSNIIAEALQKINGLRDDYIRKAQEAETLNGSEVTDDAKLLTGAFNLTQLDLETMFDRAEAAKNYTMQRLICEYADKHLQGFTRVYCGVGAKIEGAKQLANYIESALYYQDYAAILNNDIQFSRIVSKAVKED